MFGWLTTAFNYIGGSEILSVAVGVFTIIGLIATVFYFVKK